jgi:phytoene dehydrogenase-like protein
MNSANHRDTSLPPVDVAVVGAGIAGLSTAVYARRAGLSVRVFERHFIPGGLCTSWKRRGHVFDYCVHYFFGTRKEHAMYEMWKTLGVIDSVEFQHMDAFGCYRAADGRVLTLYTDYRRLRDHLLAIAPEDAKKTRAFCRAIRVIRHLRVADFSLSPRNIWRFILSIPALPAMKKWSSIMTSEWCAGLRNELLRRAIPAIIGMVGFPLIGPIMVLALMHRGTVGYPVGGSLPVALAVEERAQSLGAELVYRSGVRRVLVENGCATGIELEDGRVQRARSVVAACDAHTVLESLLEGRLRDAVYERMFQENPVHPSITQVSLGVRLDPAWDADKIPARAILELSQSISVDGRDTSEMELQNYTHDPAMAPRANTVMLVRYRGDYEYWEGLRHDRTRYRDEKQRLLAATVKGLEEYFPGIGSRIEASDVATPTTCVRYTGNWRGSTQGWILTRELMADVFAGRRPPKTSPDLANFHLAGQWTEPNGGLPPSAISGRTAVQQILRDRRRTRTATSVEHTGVAGDHTAQPA